MRKCLTKSNILFLIIGLVIGSISIVIADTINSNEVLYDNSNSMTSYDNVQDVLDDVYNIIDHSSLGFSLLAHSSFGLSTELLGGLYRYQGENVDNYICFGTTNKSDCVSDTDKYMYRIIGINTNGQMKLIKKEALNTAYRWSSSFNVDWAQSELYNGLNGSYFLTNTEYIPDNSWSNRIANAEWHYWQGTNGNVTASEMANAELSAPTTTAKIGLLYLHDYEYSLPGGNNCGHYGVPSTCKKGWIHLSNNDSNAPNSNYEKTITRQDCCNLWTIYSTGEIYTWNSDLTSSHSVRPVFFLRATETIISGSGTISDPYILS